jgi:hypothetical protein
MTMQTESCTQQSFNQISTDEQKPKIVNISENVDGDCKEFLDWILKEADNFIDENQICGFDFDVLITEVTRKAMEKLQTVIDSEKITIENVTQLPTDRFKNLLRLYRLATELSLPVETQTVL